MASVTLKVPDRLPPGATVKAYLRSNFPAVPDVPSGAPVGSEVESVTADATTGEVAFTALEDATAYVAYTLVGSEHRYVTFQTDAVVTADIQEQLDTDVDELAASIALRRDRVRVITDPTLSTSYAWDFAGDDEVWIVSTLASSPAVTVSNMVAGSVGYMLFRDGSAGTVTIHGSLGDVAITVSGTTLIKVYSPDGVGLFIDSPDGEALAAEEFDPALGDTVYSIVSRGNISGVSAIAGAANRLYLVRSIPMPKDGTLSDLRACFATSGSNYELSVFSTAATRLRLAQSGSIAAPSAAYTAAWSPNISVTRGQYLDFGLIVSSTTATFVRTIPGLAATSGGLPSGYLASSGAAPKLWGTNDPGSFTTPSSLLEGDIGTTGSICPIFIGRIT